jgi:hypothetical protein
MKRFLWLIFILYGCSSYHSSFPDKISLSGEWKFRIDSLDQGLKDRWYNDMADETVTLPGSMAENGKGYDITLNTDWTGDIVDRSYFTDKKYEKYRQPGNIKIPFWLKPVKYYKGVAWYQKEVNLPEKWEEKEVTLFLERPHWETTVFINGKKAGSENSLAVPHQYDITKLLVAGKNLISIRIDNRVVVPVGVNSHSITDHTQTNWNGITGDISLRAASRVFIDDIKVYPDIKEKSARVIVAIVNKTGAPYKGQVTIHAESYNSGTKKTIRRKVVNVNDNSDELRLIVEYPMGRKMKLWSEFHPDLYKLYVSLKGNNGEVINTRVVDFGMREFKTAGTRFTINGLQTFLRGTLECCIFPLTGYPPTDADSWMRVLGIMKNYGLNTVRFHSWCPPEAAFEAADKLGMYFQIECSSWANQGTSIGDGGDIDQFIYREGDRILKEYGNHPSFCMMAYGNEPAGDHQNEYLGKLLGYWKAKDNRRVYTSAAGWPIIPENDYNLTPAPRIQHWGEGLKSIINSQPPQTMFDYRDFVSKYKVPTVGHEIGQWCAYPDFGEIEDYKGVLKPTNFEIFRETLNENHMGGQADDFLMASGKLQALCYKADIEAALRTPGFAGFHLLQLHDFPGQGTALVGVLNSFFESKGYITPEEFRMFCSETVPLARMKKRVFTDKESFRANIEVANFGEKPLKNAVIICEIVNTKGGVLYKTDITREEIGTGNCIPVDSISFPLKDISGAHKLTLKVSIDNTPYKNSWDFWVYPDKQEVDTGNVLITDKLDKYAQQVLKKGGSVLLLTCGKVAKDKGAEVAIGFSSIFWNTAWTNNQPPHTLGILCDPQHPVFKYFPTEYHSNWQWWDPVSHSQVMIIDDLPPELRPLIQPIDTWFENRRLALAFESKTDGGRLLVCSIDMKNMPDDRLVSRQLLASVLKYMNSLSFNPQVGLTLQQINSLLR